MSGKSVLATVLAVCYAGACVGSLWNRGDAILYFAFASAMTLWFIFPPMAERFVIGMVLTGLGIVIGVGLPGVGDLIDAVGALILLLIALLQLAFRLDRWRNFAVKLPLGATCFGLYAILWFAARSLPPGLSMLDGTRHSAVFYAIAVLIAATAGLLPLLLIAWIYSLFEVPPETAVIYIIGYPFYLALYFLTFVFGGGGESLSDS